MPSRRSRFLPAAAIALFVGAGACSGASDDASSATVTTVTTTTLAPRTGDGTLRIGLMVPLTGAGATLGTPIRDAIETAVTQINTNGGVLGQPVELVIEDEEGGRLERLVAEDVDAVIGPTSSLVALAQLGSALRPDQEVVTCSPTATALSLDDYPDQGNFLFRTVPSDSMLMAAIARQAQGTGETRVSVAYLDDPYGRGLATAFRNLVEQNGVLTLAGEVAFSGTEDDLLPAARELVTDDAGVVVVLGDADDGGRFLVALDEATEQDRPTAIFVNDSIRTARQSIEQMSDDFRQRLVAVAPEARPVVDGEALPPFAANAIDCLNLIALAAEQADSDAPSRIRPNMTNLSSGAVCQTFEGCVGRLRNDLKIDYSGLSGPVDFSVVTGEVTAARFIRITFAADGSELETTGFTYSAGS